MSIPACLIASGFLASSVYTSLTKDTSVANAEFVASLTDEQKKIFRSIKDERKTLYLTGLALGAILGGAYLYYFNADTPTKRSCYFVVILMAVTNFYYLLSPKTTYMVYHLKSQEQAYLYQQNLKEMKRRHTIGLLVGMAGYALITWASTKFDFPRPDEIWDDFF